MATRLPVVLGSSSKWRRALIKDWGVEALTLHPDIDEKAIRRPSAPDLVRAIAEGKCDAILGRVSSGEEGGPEEDRAALGLLREGALLVCSDQVIVCEGLVREKPRDEAECRAFLSSYSRGHPAECHVGIVVHNTQTGRRVVGHDLALQYFHLISEDLIQHLLAQGDVMSCAGGFVSEEMGAALARTEGDLSTVQGLSRQLFFSLLKEAQEGGY